MKSNGGLEILRRYNSLNSDEVEAAASVVRSGILSDFVAANNEYFLGGKNVRQLEELVAEHFNVKYCVAVNSWTSGLICAVGAIGVEPGDEVILPTWTMSASAASILHWNAIPVFCDICPNTFNIDTSKIESLITSKTKAIMAVDIFGLPCDWKVLQKICDEHGLRLIFDTAQSPGVMRDGQLAGTCGDIGGFSLNYHKHIHCGEGGLIVTNDAELYRKMCLIRNHAEAVLKDDFKSDLCNMIGYNFRMGEIEAAISKMQLPKLDDKVNQRQRAAEFIISELSELPGISFPETGPDISHAYYVLGMTLDLNIIKMKRSEIIKIFNEHGIMGMMNGYANIHMLPMFQKKIAYGSKGFPWSLQENGSETSYSKGICPVAENLHDESFLGFEMCRYELNREDLHLFTNIFKKVWDHVLR